jgi:hypothetical protein
MFILTVNENLDNGAYAVVDDEGENALYFFEDIDDAERYVGLLEAEDYPKMQIVEVDDEVAIKTCEMYNYHYVIIKPEDFVIPPKQDALYSKN